MIAAYLREISYMSEGMSYAAIARETGIPYRQILKTRTGPIRMTAEQRYNVRKAYRREAYGRLRATGFAPHQAKRWSQTVPVRVQIITSDLRLKIADLTNGAIANHFDANGIPTSPYNVDQIYDSMYDKVKSGIEQSELPTEEIMDY